MKTLISAVLMAGAVTIAMAASATGQTSSPHAARTLRFTQRETHFAFVDAPPKQGVRKPPTEGDEFVIGGRLAQAGTTVGSTNVVCTTTQPGAHGSSTCDGVAVVPGGTVAFAGESRVVANANTFAITGGTGRYEGATGSLLAGEQGNVETITIRLR